MENEIDVIVIPETPKTIADQEIFVYIPNLDVRYYKQEEIDAMLGAKLDKRTGTGTITYVYGFTGSTQKQISIDEYPTPQSENLVKSGEVYNQLFGLDSRINSLNVALQEKATYDYVDEKIAEIETGTAFVAKLEGEYDETLHTATILGKDKQDEILTSATVELEPLLNEAKAYTNSQVAQNTANFRGSWNTVADIPTNVNLYPQDYSGSRTPTNNDYLIVKNFVAEGFESGTWRFKYTGNWATIGKSGWLPEYKVNDTPFTQSQLSAINSGITGTKVAQITTNQNNIETLSGGVQENAQAIQELENSKLDKVDRSAYCLYAHTPTGDTTVLYATGAIVNDIPQRTTNGNIIGPDKDKITQGNYYATKDYVDDIANTKVTTYTGTGSRVYANYNGTDIPVQYATDAKASSIAYRTTDGRLKVGTPVNDDEATTKKYVDDTANTKLDKITSSGGGDRLYSVNNAGTQIMINLAVSSTQYTIAYRTTGGALNVGTPTENTHATTKKYVDDAIANAGGADLEYWE